jgi:hypothetical protein
MGSRSDENWKQGRSSAILARKWPTARLQRMKAHDMKMLDTPIRETPIRETRFGFAGPENQIMSLNIPALNEDGLNEDWRRHSFNSFDIEYDPEQPDMLRICLLETDQDNFIHTVRKSVSFPVGLLAELLSKRKATVKEVASWQGTSGEEE